MSSYASQTVGTVFGAYGSLVQGKQTSDLLDSQAQMQRRNAGEALAAAKYNADRESVIATKHIGSMGANYSASGVDMSSGSVMSVMAASAANAELDRLNIIHGGDLRAANYENQASLDELGAKHALQAGYFNALSSVVAGGSKMGAQNYGGGGTTAAAGGSGTTADGMDMAGGYGDAGGMEETAAFA